MTDAELIVALREAQERLIFLRDQAPASAGSLDRMADDINAIDEAIERLAKVGA